MAIDLDLRAAAPVNAPQWRLAPALLVALAALGATTTGASAQTARVAKSAIGCLITPELVVDVGSPVVGIVARMKVRLGDEVHVGQPLVVLRSDVEDAGQQAAKARSTIDADVRAAEARLELAQQRWVRAKALQEQGFVSPQATEQARAESEVAMQKLRQAKGLQRVSVSELGVAQAQVGQRTVRSTINGVVVERYINSGERVEDKPMLRLAKLDPLRVELVMPSSRYGSVALADQISVVPDLPGIAPVVASVTHVDPIIDAASNTFRVRLKLPNPGNKLPGGARCRVDLPGPGEAAAPAPAVVPLRVEPMAMPRKVAG